MGLAQAGPKLGVAELDVEAADLVAPQEGVHLLQVQELHLYLLPRLPRLEQQLALRGDVVLGEGRGSDQAAHSTPTLWILETISYRLCHMGTKRLKFIWHLLCVPLEIIQTVVWGRDIMVPFYR